MAFPRPASLFLIFLLAAFLPFSNAVNVDIKTENAVFDYAEAELNLTFSVGFADGDDVKISSVESYSVYLYGVKGPESAGQAPARRLIELGTF
ncbi:MAG: hypothetical protein Q8P02_04420, partial [Candidatus Micrarchaeota archaeon]|nr:hypothetical protein [Candidatus Micrarchaeota archaeon]